MPRRGKIPRIDKTMSDGPQRRGEMPFKPNLKNKRLTKERIVKSRRDLEKLSRNLGQSIGAILSQVTTNRDVSWQSV